MKEGDETPSERLVEPYTFERVLPHWLIHLGSLLRGRALLPARPDAVGAADEGALPAARRLRPPLPRGCPPGARRYAPIARYRVERGTRLTDGSALATLRVGTLDWLIERSWPTVARRSCSSRPRSPAIAKRAGRS